MSNDLIESAIDTLIRDAREQAEIIRVDDGELSRMAGLLSSLALALGTARDQIDILSRSARRCLDWDDALDGDMATVYGQDAMAQLEEDMIGARHVAGLPDLEPKEPAR